MPSEEPCRSADGSSAPHSTPISTQRLRGAETQSNHTQCSANSGSRAEQRVGAWRPTGHGVCPHRPKAPDAAGAVRGRALYGDAVAGRAAVRRLDGRDIPARPRGDSAASHRALGGSGIDLPPPRLVHRTRSIPTMPRPRLPVRLLQRDAPPLLADGSSAI